MVEDKDSPDKPTHVEDRLSYLDLVAGDTAARLYEIEKHLGLVFHAVPREIKGPIEKEIRKDDESKDAPAIETPIAIEPAKQIVEPTQPSAPVAKPADQTAPQTS